MTLAELLRTEQNRKIRRLFLAAIGTAIILILLSSMLLNNGLFDNPQTGSESDQDNGSGLDLSAIHSHPLANDIYSELENVTYFNMGMNGSDILIPNLWTPSTGELVDSEWILDFLFVDLEEFDTQRVDGIWNTTTVDLLYYNFLDDLANAGTTDFIETTIDLQFSFSLLFENQTGIHATWIKNEDNSTAVKINHVQWHLNNGNVVVESGAIIYYVQSAFSDFFAFLTPKVEVLNPFL